MATPRRVFDVRPTLDPRNDDYPVDQLLGISQHTPRAPKVWSAGQVLDQGQDGACIGFGWTGEALAEPIRVSLPAIISPIARGWPRDPDGFARHFYTEAQRRDPWPGEAPTYSGTTVLAGAKTMHALGLIGRYHWTKDVEDLIDALILNGPAVLGVDWRDGMLEAPGGRLDVSGISVGRHCVLVRGYTPDSGLWGGHDEAFLLTNSWGEGWGDGGSAWIRKPGLKDVLGPQGDVCVPDCRSLGTRPVFPGVVNLVVGRVKGWLGL